MVRGPFFRASLTWVLALSGVAPAAVAAPSKTESGPALSSSVRRVEMDPKKKASARASGVAGKEQDAAGARSHRIGRAPKQPRATMPEGSAHAEADQRARHRLAMGTTADELSKGPADPQLDALAEAERTLFPRPLPGMQPGWSWPFTVPEADRPRVEATGLPPSPTLTDPTPKNDDALAVEDARWLRSLTMPDLPVKFDQHVVKYLKFYRDSSQGQTIARVWAKKSGRYAPALRAELSRANLPTDLVWLSLIESGHNPTIRSPAGAAGMWQLIPSTARMYGLTVDRWVDERLDPARSTQAAIAFLSDLHQRFGSWPLAMAAYNMGYGGMSRAIRKFNTNDFWELCRHEAGIPWETTLYVPKIMAIAIVMNNKKAFGVDQVAPDPPEDFDVVLVEPGTPLSSVADSAGTDAQSLADANAQYRKDRTPPSRKDGAARKWRVRVPDGKGRSTARALRRRAPHPGLSTYRARFGDTLQSIASDHGMSVETLASVNKLGRTERILSGTVLLVSSNSAAKAPDEQETFVVPAATFNYPDKRQVFYRVRRGDTLASIATAFGVARTDLSTWNAVDETARLQDGMGLRIFVERDRSLSHVLYHEPNDCRVLVLGSKPFYDYFESLNGKQRLVIYAKKGDTLASIGQRYGMTVGSMERVNRRSRNDPVEVGQRLVVYTQNATDDPETTERIAPLPDVMPAHPELLPGADILGKSTGQR